MSDAHTVECMRSGTSNCICRMSEVKRYEVHDDKTRTVSDLAPFVLYSDYAALAERVKKLEEERNGLAEDYNSLDDENAKLQERVLELEDELEGYTHFGEV